MNGNVLEWVEDCWNGSYERAPTDGKAWTSGDCSSRVLRGGSWDLDPELLRSACRSWGDADDRYGFIGFRVARTLP
jgi:formylglycine-generating enzyme required for sulfatase activity